jgi:hypothetical protein
VRFFEVKQGQIDRLRSWMAELTDRAPEVRKTFRQETVCHELAYLIEGPAGPIFTSSRLTTWTKPQGLSRNIRSQ